MAIFVQTLNHMGSHSERCVNAVCKLQAHNKLAQQAFWDRGPSTQASLCSNPLLPGLLAGPGCVQAHQGWEEVGDCTAHPALARAGANGKYTYRKKEPELGYALLRAGLHSCILSTYTPCYR